MACEECAALQEKLTASSELVAALVAQRDALLSQGSAL